MTGESAFEACPPYGEGKGAYGPEDTALLTEMERTLEKLLPWLEAEGVYLLNEYLEVYRRYARRSSRYYFYRGSLYGAREALEIWAEEHGGSGGCRFVKQIGRRIRKEKASQAVS